MTLPVSEWSSAWAVGVVQLSWAYSSLRLERGVFVFNKGLCCSAHHVIPQLPPHSGGVILIVNILQNVQEVLSNPVVN